MSAIIGTNFDKDNEINSKLIYRTVLDKYTGAYLKWLVFTENDSDEWITPRPISFFYEHTVHV